jgi:hypothetical protein
VKIYVKNSALGQVNQYFSWGFIMHNSFRLALFLTRPVFVKKAVKLIIQLGYLRFEFAIIWCYRAIGIAITHTVHMIYSMHNLCLYIRCKREEFRTRYNRLHGAYYNVYWCVVVCVRWAKLPQN